MIAGEDEKVIYKTFPVRKHMTYDQCFNQDRFYDLVPDSKHKSLVYFEILSPFTENRRANVVQGQFQMVGTVRLVYHLNLAKMGFNMQENDLIKVDSQVEAQIVATLGRKAFKLDDPIKSNGAYSGFSIVPQSKDIFSKYSYGPDVEAFLLYPFSYGAVDFTVTYNFNRQCLESLTMKEPIECVTNW